MANSEIAIYLPTLFQECTIFIQRITYDLNPKVLNISVAYINKELEDAVFNATINVFETVESMKAYVTIRVPEDKNDRLFKKELMKTSIDIAKVLSRNAGNFLIRGMLENLLKSFDFEPTFPFPPVNIIASYVQLFIKYSSVHFLYSGFTDS